MTTTVDEDLIYQLTLSEVWALLNGRGPDTRYGISSFGPYEYLIKWLREAWESEPDNIGLAQAAVVTQWEEINQMPMFSAIRVGIEYGLDDDPDRPLIGLVGILDQIHRAGADVPTVKQVLRRHTVDASSLSAKDLLNLIDIATDQYGVPQIWVTKWQRTVQEQAKNTNGTTAHANGSAPPSSPPPPSGGLNTSGMPPEMIPLVLANRTDAGNAECLAALYGQWLRHCGDMGANHRWLVWNGQRWEIDRDGASLRFAVASAKARYHAAIYIQPGPGADEIRKALANWGLASENEARLNSVLSIGGRMPPFTTKIEQFDSDPWLASTPTGTLDLRTATVRPPDRNDMLTMTIGCAFDESASCPRWEQFMTEIFNGDADLIAYMQRVIGYCLTGDTREQKMFLLHGGGANGKSVFLEIIGNLLGDYAGHTGFDTFDMQRKQGVGEDLAALRGKRFVTIIETDDERSLDEARVKSVTGGDLISCRFLYGNKFTYRPDFKIMLAMNHLPKIKGTDRGIWRRIARIPFKVNFEKRQDKALRFKLQAELPGILNWALEGLRMWIDAGYELGTCRAVEEATDEYKRESDVVGLWIEEQCIIDPNATGDYLVSDEGYANFAAWEQARGSRYWLSYTSWCRTIGEKGYDSTRMRISNGVARVQKTVYLGIRLRRADENSPPLQSNFI